MFPQLLLCA